MLTNNDLTAIGNLIDEKLEQKLEEKLENKFNQKFDEKLAPITKTLKAHGRVLRQIDRDLKLLTAELDKDITKVRHRVDHVEDHLERYSTPKFTPYIG